jgi:hypothetical protein
MSIEFISYIIISHLISDFFLQTRWMANHKSYKPLALGLHIVVYTAAMFLCFVWAMYQGFLSFEYEQIIFWCCLNGFIHGVVDSVTSKITSWAAEEKRWGLFFNVVGIDQALHYLVLFYTGNVVLYGVI